MRDWFDFIPETDRVSPIPGVSGVSGVSTSTNARKSGSFSAEDGETPPEKAGVSRVSHGSGEPDMAVSETPETPGRVARVSDHVDEKPAEIREIRESETRETPETPHLHETRPKIIEGHLDIDRERAAILEFDAGISRAQADVVTAVYTPEAAERCRVILLHVPDSVPDAWARGVANLLAMNRPDGWPEPRWNALRNDAFAFLRDHGADACRLGWPDLDLFSVCPRRPLARHDAMGLVPALNGHRVVALRADAAEIAVGRNVLTFRRHPAPPTRVLVWNLIREGDRA